MIYAFYGSNSAICELDTQVFELRVNCQRVATEPLSFDLLLYLIEQRERVVSRSELIERLWADRLVCDTTVNRCVMLARKAVGDDGKSQSVIKTYHRRGYRFMAELYFSEHHGAGYINSIYRDQKTSGCRAPEHKPLERSGYNG
jgi:DNA-binding winged helix-turn-helix (wHTH) protein